MIWIEICCYIVAGLIVAKIFQRWIEKDSLAYNKLDLGGFFASIVAWPIVLVVLCVVWVISFVDWIFKLWDKS